MDSEPLHRHLTRGAAQRLFANTVVRLRDIGEGLQQYRPALGDDCRQSSTRVERDGRDLNRAANRNKGAKNAHGADTDSLSVSNSYIVA